ACPALAYEAIRLPEGARMPASKTNLGIVAGVDGSPSSKVAVYWAARDAALRKVPLTLVHVVNPILPDWANVPRSTDFEQWQIDAGKRFIDEAIKVVEENTRD